MFGTRHIIKAVLIFLFMPLYVFSTSLIEKYPSYEYVFSEFGIDGSYIDDVDFEVFVLHNEKKIKDFYERSMKRGDALLPMIRGNLMDNDLSDLFIYISMVESGFSPAIVSPKKAVGLWQFMPATAKHYKLSVCNSFDERCDPVSSTDAAIVYLRKLHKQFGKWYLAVMAYNCGEGRLKKAIKKANTDVLHVLLDSDAKYLPFETREYIKKILLVAMIGEGKMLDFTPINNMSSAYLTQVEVLGGTKLSHVAKLIDMKENELLKLNKQFRNGLIPKDKKLYNIMIPEDKMITFYLKYEIPDESRSIKPYLISHYVSLGDTLKELAEKYHTDIEEIKTANNLSDDALTLDTLLVIPVSQELFEEMLND
ncbi:MAG TPA: LysM peptidoglycan-binding domain-containing protein [Epsilonproteobacteria bacterium]|nr:LysM peptidoglycan-binding domain-containing protein [Campylobacterota bacterium]